MIFPHKILTKPVPNSCVPLDGNPKNGIWFEAKPLRKGGYEIVQYQYIKNTYFSNILDRKVTTENKVSRSLGEFPNADAVVEKLNELENGLLDAYFTRFSKEFNQKSSKAERNLFQTHKQPRGYYRKRL